MVRMIVFALLLALTGTKVGSEPVFPSVSKSERLEALDRFWSDWKRVYFREGCGGAFVDISGDGRPAWGGSASNTLTVSEAHGYGMLALVHMAGREPGVRRLFDGMLAFYRAHPAASDPGLMAWNQTRDCRDGADGGNMSATDGDLDIALALLLADRRWGGYRDAFLQAQAAILEHEVTPDGMMRLGDWATDDDYATASRSSDFMPGSFAAFAANSQEDGHRWRQIRDRGYSVWGGLSNDHASETGLVPDFLIGLPDKPQPAGANFLEGESDGWFSWNALRYPWRLALDLLETGDGRAEAHLRTINRWIQDASGRDPSRIATTYRLDGSIPDDRETGSAAFLAVFAAAALGGTGDPGADRDWSDALWSALVSRPIEDEDYYGNTLKLLAMVALAELWTQDAP
ncbi:glycosyl hydrolase family 8 [Roseibium sp. Sym1]|uniref:glycosyl hydrolase family 8 n=1 Tax=Roseibium sp. Sym1 TaxID=3016006 RepID=UPI0022B38CA0|nr:glycosyl hydrolase family 8 [Roseibium sp. Sym1]